MKISRTTALAVGILVLWLVLTWRLGSMMHLHPPILYYFRAGLWLIGIAGFAGYFLLRAKPKPDDTSSVNAEIDYGFSEASKRMRTARGVKHLNSLPTVVLLGDTGSAKTSVLAKSGLEPELIAGSAYQDFVVAPTRVLNIWFSNDTLFIDPAGTVVDDPGARQKLFKKFLPVRLDAVVSGKTPPARSVVLTLDTETFLQSGGAEALAGKARAFQTILNELSAEVGASFPVYVVFSKADRIPYFRDFADNLTDAEISEILGKTLPIAPPGNQGVYAEEQTRRLTNAFQDIYYELCDRRPALLGREHSADRLPNIYEFAREFAKLRSLLVQFLVDLCRPSQLGTTPFLRGFYFTGVRPVTVTDVAPAASLAPVPQEDDPLDSGATRIFNPRKQQAGFVQAGAGSSSTGSRKVPQWVFLSRLFPSVILRDRMATNVAQENVKVNLARRLLLATIAALALLMGVWWTVSFVNNRALVRDAVEAARAVPGASLPAEQLASLDSLRRLDRVRKTLELLRQFDREGVPLEYGAFLYAGNSLRQPLRKTYYALFRKLLLAPTQGTLLAVCSRPEAQEARGYSYLYNALKAYLITTDHHEKSTVDFLAPTLMEHWRKTSIVDQERQDLARSNFEFYAGELPDDNPYPQFAKPEGEAVQNARAFLKRSKQEDRIYQALIAEAARGLKPFVFNVEYPGSAETVTNKYPVEPAFTRSGSAAFAKELADPARYLGGEEWVLGEPINAAQDRQALKQALSDHYARDLAKTWREFLDATGVVPYGGVLDAANKLGKLSSPQSPLLQVLCVASENTKVLNQAFQPPQFVTPPGCSGKLVGSGNSNYMQALIGLGTALKAVGPIDNADPNNVTLANNNASQAENIVRTLGLSFQPDPDDPKSGVLNRTEELLRAPITRVPPLLKGAGAGPVNKAAGELCKSIQPLLNKYPFNSASTTDATINEFTDFLKPNDGKLWQTYNSTLKQLLVPSGSDYVRAPGATVNITDGFLRFFNRAAHLSQALFSNSPQPSLSFTMQAIPAPDVSHINLQIDGQTLSTDLKAGSSSQMFTWPGTAPSAALDVKFGDTEFNISHSMGLWAIWHLLDDASDRTQAGNQMSVQWTLRTSAGPTLIKGHPATVKFALDSQSSQIFRRGYFSGMACVSRAAQ